MCSTCAVVFSFAFDIVGAIIRVVRTRLGMLALKSLQVAKS